MGKFQNYFGNSNFLIIDNNSYDNQAVLYSAWKYVKKLIDRKISNPIARRWIKNELQKRDRRRSLDRAAANQKVVRKIKYKDLPIFIEYLKGSYRDKISSKGVHWRIKMEAHYGFIPGTRASDGDAVDVYVGDTITDDVYIVTQVRQKSGAFDEYKCMLGFKSKSQARAVYLAHYPQGWRIGRIQRVNIEDFRTNLNTLDQLVRAASSKHLKLNLNKAHRFAAGLPDIYPSSKTSFAAKLMQALRKEIESLFSDYPLILIMHFNDVLVNRVPPNHLAVYMGFSNLGKQYDQLFKIGVIAGGRTPYSAFDADGNLSANPNQARIPIIREGTKHSPWRDIVVKPNRVIPTILKYLENMKGKLP